MEITDQNVFFKFDIDILINISCLNNKIYKLYFLQMKMLTCEMTSFNKYIQS